MINNENEGNDNDYIIVPKKDLKFLMQSNSKILSILEGKGSFNAFLPGYYSEKEAKKLLDKKTTWFWEMRTSGRLPFSKIGRTIYYHEADIKKLLEVSKQSNA